MAIEDWCISLLDLTGVVQDDDLSQEVGSIFGWVVLWVWSDISSSEIFDWEVLHVESNIVTWLGFFKGFVMHFDWFAFSGDVEGGEGDDHTWFEETCLNSSDWDSSNTTDLVDVLQGESEWFILGSLWGFNGVECFDEARSIVPFHVLRFLDHVVS